MNFEIPKVDDTNARSGEREKMRFKQFKRGVAVFTVSCLTILSVSEMCVAQSSQTSVSLPTAVEHKIKQPEKLSVEAITSINEAWEYLLADVASNNARLR